MIGLVLQARMGSSRLPGKVMMDLCGRPMLGHILDRLKRVNRSVAVIVATTIKSCDDIIEVFARREGVDCYRGDENDVLDRYYRIAQQYKLRHIIRATADNPFVDPEEIDRLIDLHIRTGADYTHAFGLLPIGIGTECFTLTALERSWREGKCPNHREHVNEYIQERPHHFHIEVLDIPKEKQSQTLRLTVDTSDDFVVATTIYQALYREGKYITTCEAIMSCGTSFV